MSSVTGFEHPLIKQINEIPQFKQKSEEWLNQRKGFLTSSDAASALGINPYSSKDELIFKKCGFSVPFTGNIATRHGEKYEDEAIEKYCSVMGMKNIEFGLIPYKDVPRNDHRPELDFLAGSPDGIALKQDYTEETEPIMIEVKCPFRRKPIQGQCPVHYLPQVQLNMLICKCTKADFIEYVPRDRKLYITRILLDKEWLNNNLPILINFWKETLKYRTNGLETHLEYEKISNKIHKETKKLEKQKIRDSERKADEERERSVMANSCMLEDSD